MMQEWFRSAKLGVFMHWGIYADGIGPSWCMYNGQISREEYLGHGKTLTAAHYQPKEWAKLFKAAGAKYAVLTAKHHDGIALWDTRQGSLSVVRNSAARRDLLRPYCDAMREEGIRVGLYFSLLDWLHPDYGSIPGWGQDEAKTDINRFTYHGKGQADPAAWRRFLSYTTAQLKELCTEYGPIDLLWFDGAWERSNEEWQMKELLSQLHSWLPAVVINGRMGGLGDYATPERGLPIVTPSGPWEFCMPMSSSWSYAPGGKNKSVPQLIRYFTECLAGGGNLLLGIGPDPEGLFAPEQRDRLLEMGAWIHKHAEAIYSAGAGLPPGHFHGPTTLSEDRRALYLFVLDRPQGQILLRGLCNQVKRISILGTDQALATTKEAAYDKIPADLWIDIDSRMMDAYVTVIKLELDGDIRLYRGEGEIITQNA